MHEKRLPENVSESGSQEKKSADSMKEPLEVLEGIEFSESDDVYTAPFATKEETMGLLSGSEGWTLCSKGEAIYSRGFVQCGAALVRNRNTGLISLIHQSTWSDAADAVLMLQRPDDLDVMMISGPFGGIQYDTVQYFHEKDPTDSIAAVENVDLERSRKYRPDLGENKTHIMHGSALLGLTEAEVKSMIHTVSLHESAGSTNLVGKINIPLTKSEVNRWYLLYRPNENFIWIYESKSKKLFKYAGFDAV